MHANFYLCKSTGTGTSTTKTHDLFLLYLSHQTQVLHWQSEPKDSLAPFSFALFTDACSHIATEFFVPDLCYLINSG